MAKNAALQTKGLSKKFLWLMALLLFFILLAACVWFWYDVKITSIDKNVQKGAQVSNAVKG
jgi:hypothetical protein